MKSQFRRLRQNKDRYGGKTMPTMQLNVEQIIELVKQLPPEGKQQVLNVLSAERNAWWEETLTVRRSRR